MIAASEALFGQGDLAALDPDTLEAALRELPNTTTSPNASIAQLLADTGLVTSQSEGRRAIAQGGVSLDNVRVDDETATLEGRAARRHGRTAARQEDARRRLRRVTVDNRRGSDSLSSMSASEPFGVGRATHLELL